MLSVLIVNWNTKDHLKRCLESLQNFPASIGQEIIVVDNNSKDNSDEMVEQHFSAVKLIKSGTNLGYAAGNNLAFEKASGDWILTLNPDTEVVEGTLDTAIETLKQKSDCGCLSIKFIGSEGEVQHSIRSFPTLRNILIAWLKLKNLSDKFKKDDYFLHEFNYEQESYAPQPMGTFLLFRKSCLEKNLHLGKLFDEQFPIFFNEVDLLKRLADSGHKCWYTPQTFIYHHHGASTKQVKKNMVWESHKSLVRYFQKHLQGPVRLWLPFVALASYLSAFVRAKGYHAGFRP